MATADIHAAISQLDATFASELRELAASLLSALRQQTSSLITGLAPLVAARAAGRARAGEPEGEKHPLEHFPSLRELIPTELRRLLDELANAFRPLASAIKGTWRAFTQKMTGGQQEEDTGPTVTSQGLRDTRKKLLDILFSKTGKSAEQEEKEEDDDDKDRHENKGMRAAKKVGRFAQKAYRAHRHMKEGQEVEAFQRARAAEGMYGSAAAAEVGGGAAEGAGVAAGAGGLAASAGPALAAVAAVAAITAVVIALVALPGALKDFSKGLLEANRQFAEVSGSMAVIFAQLELQERRRGIEKGERLAGTARKAAGAYNELSDDTKEMEIMWGHIKNWVAEKSANIGSGIVKALGMDRIAAYLNGIFENTTPKMDNLTPADWINSVVDMAEKRKGKQFPHARHRAAAFEGPLAKAAQRDAGVFEGGGDF